MNTENTILLTIFGITIIAFLISFNSYKTIQHKTYDPIKFNISSQNLHQVNCVDKSYIINIPPEVNIITYSKGFCQSINYKR